MNFPNESAKKVTVKLGFQKSVYSVFDIAKGIPENDLASVDEFALLSYNSYQRETYSDDWSAEEVRITPLDWQKVTDIPAITATPKGRKKILGLIYEVWEKETEDTVQFALVFTGTQNWADWKSNFRWITTKVFPRRWDQYHQVHSVIKDLVRHLKNRAETKNKTWEIATTGHSLGGGLAQLAAYATTEIKRVYAFDPSPVTGFYDISKEEIRENKKGVVIYRIYEKGEALAYVRNLMKIIYPVPFIKTKDPKIVEIRYNFLRMKNILVQHGMKNIAMWLYNIKQSSLKTSE